MITKFIDLEDSKKTIEFTKCRKGIIITCEELQYPVGDSISLRISKDDLFDMIGQLLSIQAQLKAEVNNG